MHDHHPQREGGKEETSGNRCPKASTQPLGATISNVRYSVKILFILDMRLVGTLDGRSGSVASSWDPVGAAVSCNRQYCCLVVVFVINCSFDA